MKTDQFRQTLALGLIAQAGPDGVPAVAIGKALLHPRRNAPDSHKEALGFSVGAALVRARAGDRDQVQSFRSGKATHLKRPRLLPIACRTCRGVVLVPRAALYAWGGVTVRCQGCGTVREYHLSKIGRPRHRRQRRAA